VRWLLLKSTASSRGHSLLDSDLLEVERDAIQGPSITVSRDAAVIDTSVSTRADRWIASAWADQELQLRAHLPSAPPGAVICGLYVRKPGISITDPGFGELGERGHMLLTKMLGDEVAWVRQDAAMLLSVVFDDDRGIALLFDEARSGSTAERANALMHLASLRLPRAAELFHAALTDPEAWVRSAGMIGVEFLQMKHDYPTVERMMFDRDESMANAAIESVGAIAPASAPRILVPFLFTDRGHSASFALQSFASVELARMIASRIEAGERLDAGVDLAELFDIDARSLSQAEIAARLRAWRPLSRIDTVRRWFDQELKESTDSQIKEEFGLADDTDPDAWWRQNRNRPMRELYLENSAWHLTEERGDPDPHQRFDPILEHDAALRHEVAVMTPLEDSDVLVSRGLSSWSTHATQQCDRVFRRVLGAFAEPRR
jgi:hypothetical protein